MFLVEIGTGIEAGFTSLQADVLGDAANYAISLGVSALALDVRARAALLKGVRNNHRWITAGGTYHWQVGLRVEVLCIRVMAGFD
jgi:hypothetical protein